MKNKTNINKTLLRGLLLTSFVGGITACDPLGIEPTSKIDEDRFWENSQLARAYVNNFYTYSMTGSGDTFQSEQWSDNCQGNYETDWNTYRQLTFNNRQYDETTSIDGVTKPWDNSYKNLRSVNLGIEKISESTVVTDDLKKQLLGECYFFRAFVYFDMEKFWGTVPYVEKALTVNDETYLPQTKRETLFDNMLSDLTTSLKYFEESGSTPETGRINVNVVNSFISRVALYAANASEASQAGIYSNDAKGLFKFEKNPAHYYQIAYDAAKKVIGKYTLEQNYEDLFISETAHTSTESIWPVMFKEGERSGFNPTGKNGPDGKYYGGTTDKSYDWSLRTGLFPTQDLVDCYLQQDASDGIWKKWWQTSQVTNVMDITVDGDGEITGRLKGTANDDAYRKIFENRDKRFYATVTYDGALMGGRTNNDMYLIQTWTDNSDPKNSLKYSALHSGYRTMDNMNSVPAYRSSCQTISSYYSRKYSHFDTYNEDGTLNTVQRTTCYFNIRYAEVLLNCAEAAIKLGGKDAEAESYINQIRERAGLDNFNAGTAGHDLFEELKLQRRLEFAFECPGFRYFDLLRWGEGAGKTTIEELNQPSRGMYIFRKGIASEETGKNGYPAASTDEGYFKPYIQTYRMDFSYYQRKFDNARYYFVPYTITTLNDYRELQQNPGWSDFRYNN